MERQAIKDITSVIERLEATDNNVLTADYLKDKFTYFKLDDNHFLELIKMENGVGDNKFYSGFVNYWVFSNVDNNIKRLYGGAVGITKSLSQVLQDINSTYKKRISVSKPYFKFT